jgi:hypothetical protein
MADADAPNETESPTPYTDPSSIEGYPNYASIPGPNVTDQLVGYPAAYSSSSASDPTALGLSHDQHPEVRAEVAREIAEVQVIVELQEPVDFDWSAIFAACNAGRDVSLQITQSPDGQLPRITNPPNLAAEIARVKAVVERHEIVDVNWSSYFPGSQSSSMRR